MKNSELFLYLVTNRYDYSLAEFLQRIDEACQNGVTMVQLREKDATSREYYELARAVKKVTDRHHLPLIIDDRADVCLAVGAAGVHIGDDELPVAVTRRLIGPDKILGVSAKTVERALEARTEGADYLGVGAIFPTATKKDPVRTTIAELKEIVDESGLPTVAIGGIKEGNLQEFAGSGIDGVAIVSDIMKAGDTGAKVRALAEKLKGVLADGNDQ